MALLQHRSTPKDPCMRTAQTCRLAVTAMVDTLAPSFSHCTTRVQGTHVPGYTRMDACMHGTCAYMISMYSCPYACTHARTQEYGGDDPDGKTFGSSSCSHGRACTRVCMHAHAHAQGWFHTTAHTALHRTLLHPTQPHPTTCAWHARMLTRTAPHSTA